MRVSSACRGGAGMQSAVKSLYLSGLSFPVCLYWEVSRVPTGLQGSRRPHSTHQCVHFPGAAVHGFCRIFRGIWDHCHWAQ